MYSPSTARKAGTQWKASAACPRYTDSNGSIATLTEWISLFTAAWTTCVRLCEKHHVHQLDLFGSAAEDRFNSEKSDLDFLVEFEDLPPAKLADSYFYLLNDPPRSIWPAHRLSHGFSGFAIAISENSSRPQRSRFMLLRARKLLEDIREAAEAIYEFTAGKTLENYRQDRLTRSGVEREFLVIGEAVSQLANVDQQTVGDLGDYRRMVDFRNILAHAYSMVNDEVVWGIIENELPDLKKSVDELLKK